MSNYISTGCPAPLILPEDPSKLWEGGTLNFKASQVGWLVSGAFTLVAVVVSAWLIDKHLRYFFAPHTQRHIVRILFLVPIYAICSFLSYYFYHQALYFQLIRDCYEAIVISAFFSLLLAYLSTPPPTPENPCPAPLPSRAERAEQLREVVKDVHIKKWMWPLGRLKWQCAGGGKGEGEAFLWLMRICIGQYVIVRPLSTAVAVVSEAFGRYCLASWGPSFTHLWTALAITISVTVAMYAVLQLYMPFKKELAPFSPILKFLAVKSVVFLTFWQESALSFAASPLGIIKDQEYWTAHDQVIGYAALLSCFEMMCFGFLHIKAFSYLPYRALAPPVVTQSDADSIDSEPMPKSFAAWTAWEERKTKDLKAAARLANMKIKPGQVNADGTPILQQTKRWASLLKVLVMTDLGRELKEETVYLARRGKPSRQLQRRDDLEEVLGKKRLTGGVSDEKDWSRDGDEEEPGTVESLERDLRRLKQGKGRDGARVGVDGSLVTKNGRQGEESDSLLHAEEGRIREWQLGTHEARAGMGWWGTLSGRSMQRQPAEPTFAQIARPSSPSDRIDPTTALRPPPRILTQSSPAPPRRPSAPPRPSNLSMPSPLASSDIPFDSMAHMGPVLPPHVDSVPRVVGHPALRASRRLSAGGGSNFHQAASGIRHPAMVDAQSERSLVLATEESKRSAGLPPGAAPPAGVAGPSKEERTFLFEEY